MVFSKNRQIVIEKEALTTLGLMKEGTLSPVENFMNKEESYLVDKNGTYRGLPFPLSLTFAPNGKRNQETIKSAKKDEILDIYCEDKKVGFVRVDEVFEIDQKEKIYRIFDDTEENKPIINYLLKKLGNFAISGNFDIEYDDIKKIKDEISAKIQSLNAKVVSAIMMVANPFHRAHERLLRVTLEKSDLVVIFLLKHSTNSDLLPLEYRHKALQYFIENYVHKNNILIIPFDNTYIYANNKNAILKCIIAKNFGCNRIAFGEYHDGLGMFYDKNQVRTSLENYKNLINVDLVAKLVYCNECNTLVNAKTCPHGHHRHIKYNSNSLIELLRNGILPPAILMRKDISAILLSLIFPNRFKNVTQIYDDLFPGIGLIETHSDRDFYIELMKLYQTTSLT